MRSARTRCPDARRRVQRQQRRAGFVSFCGGANPNTDYTDRSRIRVTWVVGHFKERCFPQRAQSRKEDGQFHLGFLGVFAPLREILNSNCPTNVTGRRENLLRRAPAFRYVSGPMKRRVAYLLAFFAVALFLGSGEASVTKAPATQVFDEFGRVGHCDLGARLDNFAIQLQHEPSMTGYIVAYGPEGEGVGSGRSR